MIDDLGFRIWGGVRAAGLLALLALASCQPLPLPAADFIGEVRATNATGRLVTPTNFFYANLLMGSNLSYRLTNGGRMILDAGGGGGSADLGVTNLYTLKKNGFATNLTVQVLTNYGTYYSPSFLGNYLLFSDVDLSINESVYTPGDIGDLQAATNALRTLLLNNDIITSNGVVTVLIANDAATSNALKTVIVNNDITTSNGVVNLLTNRIASSNLNYVLKYNGASDGQTATNLTEQFAITINHQSGDVLIIGGNLGGITTDGDATVNFNGGNSVALEDSQGGGVRSDNGRLTLLGPLGGTTNTGTLDVAGDSTFYSDLFVQGGLGVTGGGNLHGPFKVWDGVIFNQPTGSRLAALDSLNHLTNSAYADADIAALQAATNTLTSSVNSKQIGSAALTNLSTATVATNVNPTQLSFVSGTLGVTNGALLTNAVTYSGTNTAQASNQTVLTVRGLAGQSAPFISVSSNGVTDVFQVDRSGNVVISNSLPSITLSNNAHKFALNTSDGFTLNFLQDASSVATLNNAGGFNATTYTLSGGQIIYKAGVGTNGFGAGSSSGVPTGAILASNLWLLGNEVIIGGFTNKSTIYAPTNTAPFFTTNFSTPLLVTNLALPQRALLFVQLAFDDVTGGIPSCTVIATNNVSTNNFGSISPTLSGLTLVGTVTITNHYTYPLDTNVVIKFTDTSTGGAAVRMVQSILFAQ